MVFAEHRMADYFFALSPSDPSRMRRISELASSFNVEIETHPVKPEEYKFLLDGELNRLSGGVLIARRYLLSPGHQAAGVGTIA